jgi:deoxycytidine triphosphate deaminase
VILSDREIRAALERGSIRITPDPRTDASLWSSTAVDLRLGEPISSWVFPPDEAPQTLQPGTREFADSSKVSVHERMTTS